MDGSDYLTLADHAEMWWREQGKTVPDRDSPAWDTMYETWIDFAFALPLPRT